MAGADPKRPPDHAHTSDDEVGRPLGAAEVSDREEHDDLKRRLQYLMIGRLVVASILLGGTMLLALDQDRGAAAFTPRFLLALIQRTLVPSDSF